MPQVSEIEASSRNRARTLGNADFKSQIVSKCSILDSYPHDFRRRFQLYPPQVLNPTADVELGKHVQQNLGNIENFDIVKSSFMKSRGVK